MYDRCTEFGCPVHNLPDPDLCTGCHAASEHWCSCPDGYSPAWWEQADMPEPTSGEAPHVQ